LPSSFFERSNPRTDAAVIMGRLIDLLPPQGIVSAGLCHEIWAKSIYQSLIRELVLEALENARDTNERSNHYADNGCKVRLRSCLEKTHDELLKSLNKDYWKGDAGL
jgi:hypothetical protein